MKPVLLTLDDDPQVLLAIERDLRQHYGKRFRVLRAESGIKALAIVKQLKLQNKILSLLLVDQRMPQMTGVEFLEQAMTIFPEAKRVLITAYTDTEAAIRSINNAKIDYYLMKPWEPPEEHLYPILDDLLDDWWASFKPPFEGIRVIGLRWSPRSDEAKYFLATNGVPYQWLDIESEEARQLVSFIDSTRNSDSSDSDSSITTKSVGSDNISNRVKSNNKNKNNIASTESRFLSSNSSFLEFYVVEPTSCDISRWLIHGSAN